MTINPQSIFTLNLNSEKTSDCRMKKLNKNKKTCLEVLAWQEFRKKVIFRHCHQAPLKAIIKCTHHL